MDDRKELAYYIDILTGIAQAMKERASVSMASELNELNKVIGRMEGKRDALPENA